MQAHASTHTQWQAQCKAAPHTCLSLCSGVQGVKCLVQPPQLRFARSSHGRAQQPQPQRLLDFSSGSGEGRPESEEGERKIVLEWELTEGTHEHCICLFSKRINCQGACVLQTAVLFVFSVANVKVVLELTMELVMLTARCMHGCF